MTEPRSTEHGARIDAELDVDVAIIGGGPAGAAAALTLLHYTGRRVAVIERSAFEAPRVGESTSSAIQSLLRFVGASHVLSEQTAHPACAAAAAWGGPDPMVRHAVFTSQGDGLLLDRRAFDAALCGEVAARGGRVLLHHALRGAERRGDHWQLALTGATGEPVTVRCRFAIDASGRRASLARLLGVPARRDDRLVGVAIRFAPRAGDDAGAGGDDDAAAARTAEPAATLVEATPDGWWYSAPLPDGQLIAVFMTDAPLVRALRLSEPDGVRRCLDDAPCTRARVVGREAPAPPQIASACSQRLAVPAGPGWAAAGDAAVAFDPLSSLGIGHALWSGAHAARLAEDVLLGPSSFADHYGEAIEQQYRQYLALRQRYYRLERRWCDRPFWRSRSELPRGFDEPPRGFDEPPRGFDEPPSA